MWYGAEDSSGLGSFIIFRTEGSMHHVVVTTTSFS
jgi:hypothetical protein